jgi:hypothetical protein
MPIPVLDDVISYGKAVWGLTSYLWRWARRNKRTLTSQQKLELRLKWKPEFEGRVYRQRKEHINDEVIIRDMQRIDQYPNSRGGKGISAWFRGYLLSTYEKGIMVGLSWEELKIVDDDQLRFCNWQEEGDVTLMRTGFIPYEGIEQVDWEGDRHYPDPHIYCYFDQSKRQPYAHIRFCEERENSYTKYWVEIADYQDVRELSRKMKVRRWPKKSRLRA